MPRSKEANQLLKDKRSRQILNTALRLFCIEDYEKVTMDRIAKESKISHGLVYHYFNNKSEILSVLIDEGKEKFSEIFEINAFKNAKGEEFYKKLTDFVTTAVAMGDNYSYYISLFLSFRIDSKFHENFTLDNSQYRILEENFIMAQKEGKFAEGNPKDYIICYFYILKSIALASIHSKGKAPVPSSDIVINLLRRSS